MEEIWKIYKDKRGNSRGCLWEVSNYGNVKKNGKLMDYSNMNKKYITICRNEYLHKVIASLFIPNPENKPQVDHIDTNIYNNRVDNLRWVTPSENSNNPLTLKHNRESNIGHLYHPFIYTNEIRNKMSISSKERIKKFGSNLTLNTGRKWFNNGIEEILIYENNIDYYKSIGYTNGRLKSTIYKISESHKNR